ncbi:hypothetical protein DOTSEDRAFT_69988 [Dothistroma septosporum NZE10]|uniref:Uncharacterized protein n=1 Tax=Dothistroma septosporum (strain NZE10 / CBS 128990) TaxID=675120 RepID=N1Q177_DOTSN|nr:hypothetical protein DOTSEDRAFT_69988 [Dothistroma septosporum NZE10]
MDHSARDSASVTDYDTRWLTTIWTSGNGVKEEDVIAWLVREEIIRPLRVPTSR